MRVHGRSFVHLAWIAGPSVGHLFQFGSDEQLSLRAWTLCALSIRLSRGRQTPQLIFIVSPGVSSTFAVIQSWFRLVFIRPFSLFDLPNKILHAFIIFVILL